jgi:alkaline phosphatase D
MRLGGVFFRFRSIFVSIVIGFGICLSLEGSALPPEPVQNSLPSLIAFGSCNLQKFSQKYWRTISSLNPDIWIWLGDIIYADGFTTGMRERAYSEVKKAPGYQTLSSHARILGTWDDHDFGYNNSGAGYRGKEESQRVLLDFLDEPESSPRRKQAGVYSAYRFQSQGRTLKILMLDLRYFREPEGPGADLLGPEQWRWLESELAQDPAELTLIGSSSQVLAWGGGTEESWVRYPSARARLLDLLRRTPGQHLILSGDRHFLEISKMALDESRTLYDFTSSGLTHAHLPLWRRKRSNPLRVGRPYGRRNFGVVHLDWNEVPVRVSLEPRSI